MTEIYMMEIKLNHVRKSQFLDGSYLASFDVKCEGIGFHKSFDYFCDTMDEAILKNHKRFVLELKKRIEDYGINKGHSIMAQTFKRKIINLLKDFFQCVEKFEGNPEHIVDELKKIQIVMVLTDDDLK